jgi:hypothetical protein
MNEGCVPQAKKSLMNSIERLNGKSNMIEDLARMSERLIEKLERTEDCPKPTSDSCEKSSSRPDIIDMFNGVDSRLERLANQIGRNIEKAIGMID